MKVPEEVDEVLALLSAGFPRERWDDERTYRLWRLELEEVSLAEGITAARATIRGHEFLSFKAFSSELAAVRERRADEHPWPARALYSANDPPSTQAQGLAHIAECRAALEKCRGPLASSLKKMIPPTGPRPWARPDEPYMEQLLGPAPVVEPETTTNGG